MLGHLKDLGVTNCLQTRQPQENMDYNLSPQVQKNHLTSDPPASKKQVLTYMLVLCVVFPSTLSVPVRSSLSPVLRLVWAIPG